jgi:hypothetical protein
MLTVATIQSGIPYGPNSAGKCYISLFKHRGCGDPYEKTVWCKEISPEMEYATFCFSDENNIIDNKGNLWGFRDDGREVLGQNGEVFCKFPVTSNVSDPWHGYPVSPAESVNDIPPPKVVQEWITRGVVSRLFGRRIQRRKI